jgi:hypothetical protein
MYSSKVLVAPSRAIIRIEDAKRAAHGKCAVERRVEISFVGLLHRFKWAPSNPSRGFWNLYELTDECRDLVCGGI